MIASVILIISGYVFIHLNNLSKQKSNDQCHRCGSATFGRKCLKCGYENYAKEDFKANSFMSFCGVIFLLAGIALLPITYVRTNNVSKNKVVDFISNIIEDIEIITDVDDQDNIIDNTPVENTIVNNTVTNNTNKNTSANTNTNTTTNKKIEVLFVGTGKSYDKCKVNSFTGTIKKVNPNQYMFNYSINLTNNKEESTFSLSNVCQVYISLYNENNELIDKWSTFKMLNPNETDTVNSFQFIYQYSDKYTAILSEK